MGNKAIHCVTPHGNLNVRQIRAKTTLMAAKFGNYNLVPRSGNEITVTTLIAVFLMSGGVGIIRSVIHFFFFALRENQITN